MWIQETGHSKITLLLQLDYSLQNSLIIVKHPEGGCPRSGCSLGQGSLVRTSLSLGGLLFRPDPIVVFSIFLKFSETHAEK